MVLGWVRRAVAWPLVRFSEGEICGHGIFRLRPLANESATFVRTTAHAHPRSVDDIVQDIPIALLCAATPPLRSPCAIQPLQWPRSCVPAFSSRLSKALLPRSACCRPWPPPSTARSPSNCDQLSNAQRSSLRHALPHSMLHSAIRFCPHCHRRSREPQTTLCLCQLQTTPTEATTGALRGVCNTNSYRSREHMSYHAHICYEKSHCTSTTNTLSQNRLSWSHSPHNCTICCWFTEPSHRFHSLRPSRHSLTYWL